jgi:GNAT superfamily N-acetyltransferase
MGVRLAQRGGIGKALMETAQAWLRGLGVEYLQVKTLGPSHSDTHYARTRLFYQAQGFRPLEEFKQIWDENNPCLVLVKRL